MLWHFQRLKSSSYTGKRFVLASSSGSNWLMVLLELEIRISSLLVIIGGTVICSHCSNFLLQFALVALVIAAFLLGTSFTIFTFMLNGKVSCVVKLPSPQVCVPVLFRVFGWWCCPDT